MDDQRFSPRPARPSPTVLSAAAEAPPRARPARPIRFTPSRTAPGAPPLLEQHAPADNASLAARFGTWLLITAGWGVFAAWWVIVLRRESMRSLGVAFALVGGTIAVTAIAMTLWTRHNIRIARRGKRGISSLYIPMTWERDTLGRPLELPPLDGARTASEIRVLLQGGVKTYVVTEEEL